MLLGVDVAGRERRQRHRLREAPPLLVEVALQPRDGARQLARGDVDAGPDPADAARLRLRGGVEQGHRADPAPRRVAPEVGVPLADGDGDDALGEMRVDDDARVDLSVVRRHGDELALLGPEGLGGVGGHLDPGAPGGLQQGVGDLLQPGAVGPAAVEEVQRRIRDQAEPRPGRGGAELGREVGVEDAGAQGRLDRVDGERDAAAAEGVRPPGLEVGRFGRRGVGGGLLRLGGGLPRLGGGRRGVVGDRHPSIGRRSILIGDRHRVLTGGRRPRIGGRRARVGRRRLRGGLGNRLHRLPRVAQVAVEVAAPGQKGGHVAAERARRLDEQVAHMAGVEHRPHRRLHQAPDPAAGVAVTPRLEGRVHRQQQVGLGGGLVRQARQGGHVRHLGQRPPEIRRGGHREHRVDVVDDGQLYLARPHRLGQRLHLGVGRGVGGGRGAEIDRRSDVAGDMVQEGDGDLGRRRVGARHAHPATHREGPAGAEGGVRERARDLADAVGGEAGGAAHGFGRHPGDEVADAGGLFRRHALRPLLAHDDLHHGRGHEALGLGGDGVPGVGARPGHREAGLDLHEPRRAAVADPARPRVVAGEPGRRAERLQEVRPERDHHLGPGEVVVGDLPAPEDALVGGADRLVAERLVADPARPEGGRPARDEPGEGAGQRRRDQRHAVAAARLVERLQPVDEILLRLFPRDRIEHAPPRRRVGDAATVGPGDAIGVVQPLQRGLAPHAEPAAVDGVLGVALDLDRPALPGADADAAAGRALPADAGVPRGDAGNDVVGGHHEGDDPLGRHRRAGGGRRRGAGAAQHLEERPAADPVDERRRGVSHSTLSPAAPNPAARAVSSDMPDNPGWRPGPRGSLRTSPC